MLGKTEGSRRRGRQRVGGSKGQRSLACCSPWGRRVGRDFATEQQRRMSLTIFCKLQVLPGRGDQCKRSWGHSGCDSNVDYFLNHSACRCGWMPPPRFSSPTGWAWDP